MHTAVTIVIFDPDITTTTNKHMVINVDLNVGDKGADERQEQQMKHVPGHTLRGVRNKVAAVKRARAKQHYRQNKAHGRHDTGHAKCTESDQHTAFI